MPGPLFEMLGSAFQLVDDIDFLRAHVFARTAFYAFACGRFRLPGILPLCELPVFGVGLQVQQAKDVGMAIPCGQSFTQ